MVIICTRSGEDERTEIMLMTVMIMHDYCKSTDRFVVVGCLWRWRRTYRRRTILLLSNYFKLAVTLALYLSLVRKEKLFN